MKREECQRVLPSDLLPFYNTLPSIDVQKRNAGLLSERLFPFFFFLPLPAVTQTRADGAFWILVLNCSTGDQLFMSVREKSQIDNLLF